MESTNIDESKYQIRDILISQKSEDNTRMLFERFHSVLSDEFIKHGCYFDARTHIRGITYFAKENKAFLGLNIQQKHLSLLYFTGDYLVRGVEKGNWMCAGDGNGSKMFRISNESRIDEAVKAAMLCYRIAAAWPLSVDGGLINFKKL